MAENCKEIFSEMAGKFDPAAAGDWETTIQFHIAGDKGGDFVVKIGGGELDVSEGTNDSPSATIETDDETWMGIVAGTTNPMTAFTLGKLKIKGNMGDVMKLQNMIK
jgi:putative sterol carrier protein